jgi:UPF0716 protein FxsA
MFLILLVILLPLLEIIGFIMIGGEIGIGWSLLWVIMDAIVGLTILNTLGDRTLHKAKKAVEENAFPFEEMFDGFCIIVGALLLIFPGFISDLLALPLLIPPVRHWIFVFLKHKHRDLFNDLGKTSRGFAYWYYEERNGDAGKTIEGNFRNTDKDDKLLK